MSGQSAGQNHWTSTKTILGTCWKNKVPDAITNFDPVDVEFKTGKKTQKDDLRKCSFWSNNFIYKKYWFFYVNNYCFDFHFHIHSVFFSISFHFCMHFHFLFMHSFIPLFTRAVTRLFSSQAAWAKVNFATLQVPKESAGFQTWDPTWIG